MKNRNRNLKTMKTITKNVPWVITFLAIVIFGFVTVKFNTTIREYQNNRQNLTDSIAKLDRYINVVFENLLRNYENNGAMLDLQKEYINNDYNRVKLSDYVKTGIMVFRFSDSDCMDCVYSALPLVDSLENRLGKGKIIILSTFNTKEGMVAFAEANNIHVPVLLDQGNLHELALEENNKTPYFFLLNKEGYMRNLFLPDKFYPDLTRRYFKMMHNCLLKNKVIPSCFQHIDRL
jgi:hypothetical protein